MNPQQQRRVDSLTNHLCASSNESFYLSMNNTDASLRELVIRAQTQRNEKNSRTLKGLEELKTLVGKEIGTSSYFKITQDRVNSFAESTGDFQWIHIDPERATNESPFGGPIAHGFLTLSLAPMFAEEVMPNVEGIKYGVNYGFNKIRFLSPVPVGGNLRCKFELQELTSVSGGNVDAPKGTIRTQAIIDKEIEMYRDKSNENKIKMPESTKERQEVLRQHEDFSSLKFENELKIQEEKANKEIKEGKHEEALKRLYWILTKTPYDVHIRLQRATLLQEMSRFEEAIKDCDKVIKTSLDGEYLSESYTLKGLCFMRMGKYHESIIAFERSLLLINDPKVLDLKKKVEILLYPETVIVPTYEDDYEFFKGVSSTLMDNATVQSSQTHGRGIFATRDMDEEELLFEIPAIISIPTNLVKNKVEKHDSDHCYHCQLSLKPLSLENEKEISKSKEFFKIQETLHRLTNLPVGDISGVGCPSCNEAVFCSNDCYSEGIQHHSLVCSGKNSFHNYLLKFYHECEKLDDDTKSIYLLMLRLFSIQFNAGDQNSPLRPMELDGFIKRLVHSTPTKKHSTPLTRQDNKMFQLMKNIFMNREITTDIFQRVKSIVQLNALIFPTSTIRVLSERNPMDELGWNFDFEEVQSRTVFSILQQASFFNHSCEPNIFIATPVVNDKSIRFCTRRPIKKGEELFITYLDGFDLDTETRKTILNTTHMFTCKCPSCTNNKTIKSLSIID
ncbi:hypothetical protein DICPUDRAFT_93608 [Dictyostelium purpureum]|uniref:SET domain-containing protein n=1 Tax=Dictyostelium purpureum TaxID=5786 RepID=F0Z9L8_DICPU|nr:uncharacterized protein DICPUDRAFT_93608 [Dictyostelium purpureum]EGC39320.1 hypothetical protein DICPUDRAFT_93608 [Dictyostelium purpureum]|eukprot:XP_003284108.1 hypothetical protein DICPUDRAFT_93608 [Dictyostelium purpureum]